ncbi:MAG TPA: outer membrane beta-barrel protein [Gemmatimonadaceae bacterium]|nr:outer membrane beta-barrel protein [Gemmatimonadaceae bacterium]
MRKFAIVLTSLTSLGVAASAQAQGPSVGDLAGYVALSATPVGAMTPVVSSAMLGRIAKGYSVTGQYGHLSDDAAGFNSFGASVSMPLSGFTVGGSLGFMSPSAQGSKSNLMLGANAETNLGAWALGQGKNANLFTLSARGDFGWANPDDGSGNNSITALSLSAGAPLALVLKNGDMTWAPFVTPGLGWGRLSATGASESGTRFMMGAGLGMTHRNGWGVSAGMQKVFIDNGKTVFGLNISYGK